MTDTPIIGSQPTLNIQGLSDGLRPKPTEQGIRDQVSRLLANKLSEHAGFALLRDLNQEMKRGGSRKISRSDCLAREQASTQLVKILRASRNDSTLYATLMQYATSRFKEEFKSAPDQLDSLGLRDLDQLTSFEWSVLLSGNLKDKLLHLVISHFQSKDQEAKLERWLGVSMKELTNSGPIEKLNAPQISKPEFEAAPHISLSLAEPERLPFSKGDELYQELRKQLSPQNTLIKDLCDKEKSIEKVKAFAVLDRLNATQLPDFRGRGPLLEEKGAGVLRHILKQSETNEQLKKTLVEYGQHKVKTVLGSDNPGALARSLGKNAPKLSLFEWAFAFKAMSKTARKDWTVSADIRNLRRQVIKGFGAGIGSTAMRFLGGRMTSHMAACLDPQFRALDAKIDLANHRAGRKEASNLQQSVIRGLVAGLKKNIKPQHSTLTARVCGKGVEQPDFNRNFRLICDLSVGKASALVGPGGKPLDRNQAQKISLQARQVLAYLCRRAQSDKDLATHLRQYGTEYFNDRVQPLLDSQLRDTEAKKILATQALNSAWIVPVFHALSGRSNPDTAEKLQKVSKLLDELGYSEIAGELLQGNSPKKLINYLESAKLKEQVDEVLKANGRLTEPPPKPSRGQWFRNALRRMFSR